jgi:hypothetical protein
VYNDCNTRILVILGVTEKRIDAHTE